MKIPSAYGVSGGPITSATKSFTLSSIHFRDKPLSPERWFLDDSSSPKILLSNFVKQHILATIASRSFVSNLIGEFEPNLICFDIAKAVIFSSYWLPKLKFRFGIAFVLLSWADFIFFFSRLPLLRAERAWFKLPDPSSIYYDMSMSNLTLWMTSTLQCYPGESPVREQGLGRRAHEPCSESDSDACPLLCKWAEPPAVTWGLRILDKGRFPRSEGHGGLKTWRCHQLDHKVVLKLSNSKALSSGGQKLKVY